MRQCWRDCAGSDVMLAPTSTRRSPIARFLTLWGHPQALMEATGRSMAQLKKELEVTGDMGSVAAASRGSQRTMMAPKRLTVQSVRTLILTLP